MMYTERIKQYRQTHKITQANIAEILQIPQQQWQRYEAGINELPIRYLIAICKHFQISADWLLGLDESTTVVKQDNIGI